MGSLTRHSALYSSKGIKITSSCRLLDRSVERFQKQFNLKSQRLESSWKPGCSIRNCCGQLRLHRTGCVEERLGPINFSVMKQQASSSSQKRVPQVLGLSAPYWKGPCLTRLKVRTQPSTRQMFKFQRDSATFHSSTTRTAKSQETSSRCSQTLR